MIAVSASSVLLYLVIVFVVLLVDLLDPFSILELLLLSKEA